MPVKWDCFASLPFSLSLSLSPYHSLFLFIAVSGSLSLSLSLYHSVFLLFVFSLSSSFSLSPHPSLFFLIPHSFPPPPLSVLLSPYSSLLLLIPIFFSILFLIITLSFSLSLSLFPYSSLYPTPLLSNIFFLITNLSRFPQAFIFILPLSFSSPPVSLHSPALYAHCTPLQPCSLFKYNYSCFFSKSPRIFTCAKYTSCIPPPLFRILN
jgi:hypothetical protein